MAVNKLPLYIVDASVFLKWFLEKENYQENALKIQSDFLRKRIILGMPSYALAEFMNTVGRKYSVKQSFAALSILLTFAIKEYDITLETASFALAIMEQFPGVSFYDAEYHALALLEHGTFITADDNYFSKTKRKGNIIHLRDYGKKRRL